MSVIIYRDFAPSTIPASSCAQVHQLPDKAAPGAEDMDDVGRVRPWLKRFLRPIKKVDASHFSFDELADFGIKVVKMSFDTGIPEEGTQYIKPVSAQVVQHLINDIQPIKPDQRNDFADPKRPGLKRHDTYHETYFIFIFMQRLLEESRDEAGFDAKIIPHRSSWRDIGRNYPDLCLLTADLPGCIAYQILSTLVYAIPQPTDQVSMDCTPDTSVPHLLSCSINGYDLPNDKLTKGEIISLIFMALDRASESMYKKHQVYPVTIISGSSRTFRVVQGVFDFNTHTFDVRVTPSVSFPRGARPKWNRFCTLLGWALGHPVGETM